MIEVGLHFEDGPVSTAAYLAYFDAHIVERKHELGPELELERWTPSWGRIYELVPLTRLDGRPGRADRPAAGRADRDAPAAGRGGGNPAGAVVRTG